MNNSRIWISTPKYHLRFVIWSAINDNNKTINKSGGGTCHSSINKVRAAYLTPVENCWKLEQKLNKTMQSIWTVFNVAILIPLQKIHRKQSVHWRHRARVCEKMHSHFVLEHWSHEFSHPSFLIFDVISAILFYSQNLDFARAYNWKLQLEIAITNHILRAVSESLSDNSNKL